MSETYLKLTPHDPLIARDGRPFGAGQGQRMRGLPWLLPSVVAGSFRTALVKAGSGDFSGDLPQRLMQIAVAGVFPVHAGEFYLPAPNDCVWDEKTNKVHRVQPIPLEAGEDVDFPKDSESLWPVRLSAKQSEDDFKAKATPAWWPINKLVEWLTSIEIEYKAAWFTNQFLQAPRQSIRDHVELDAERGAAAEGRIFASANLNVTHLARYDVATEKPFRERFAEVTLTARVTIPDTEKTLKLDPSFDLWHPLGGERRMVHWQTSQKMNSNWECPKEIKQALESTKKVRMVLATPAIFKNGWKPDRIVKGLNGVNLKLVGVSNGRWKAVSGWSLAPPRGPKAIRRMVPAGSVYFFEVEKPGDASPLENYWLKSVSDDEQEQRDGFGLALWGTW